MRPTINAADLRDGTMGICLACGEEAWGVEPDAECYECESCGEHEVMGNENAVISDLVDVEGW